MKLILNVETLKTLLARVEVVRHNASVDDIHASNNDEYDHIELTFNASGYTDQKAKEHEEYDHVMIDKVKIFVKCEAIYDEEVGL